MSNDNLATGVPAWLLNSDYLEQHYEEIMLLNAIRNGTFSNKIDKSLCFPHWQGNYSSYTFNHSSYISHGNIALVIRPANDNAYQERGILSYIPYNIHFKVSATGAFSFRVSIVTYEYDGSIIPPQNAIETKGTNWKYETGKDEAYIDLTTQNGWYEYDDIARFKKDGNKHANKIRLMFKYTGTSGELKLNDVVLWPVKNESSYNAPTLDT